MGRRRTDIARQDRRWLHGFTVVAAACLLIFSINITVSEVRAGNVWGLAYGIAATVLMVLAAFLGLRRRTLKTSSRLPVGSSRIWLRLHIYGGGLFLVMVLFHAGFRFPEGALHGWLWGLSWWTVISGLVGLGLQTWIPKVLASGLSVEVLYERIPQLVDEVQRRAEALARSCSDPVQALYTRSVAPALVGPRHELIYYFDITGGIRAHLRDFDYLRTLLPAAEKDKLAELEQLFRTKLEMDAHFTLQRALRVWLYAHVPLSLLLLALVAVHIFTVWYY